MLKQTIKYTNFDDEEVEGTFWFNMTKTELLEFEVGYPGGFEKTLNHIIDTDDREGLIREFKKLILTSYGLRDGDDFNKSEEISHKFSNSAAYDAFFMGLFEKEDAAVKFFKGVMPKALVEEAERAQVQDKPTGPPPIPSTAARALIDSHKMPPPSAG